MPKRLPLMVDPDTCEEHSCPLEPVLEFICDTARHLVCRPYNVKNLHKMAEALGIKRHWFHRGFNPHYDIPKKMISEVTAKCTVVSTREIIEIILAPGEQPHPIKGQRKK